MLPACICVSRAVFSKMQCCSSGGRQRISVPGVFFSSCCLTWSSEPGLLGFALWWPWWVVVSTACHGFLAPQHFWTRWSFFRLLRKFVETSREHYLNICYPWEGFAFASSLSHFLLPLLSSALEKPLHWATACSLLRVVTCRQLWTQSSLNQTHSENMKYSLVFITEEMGWLNAALFIANTCTRGKTPILTESECNILRFLIFCY